MITQEQLESSFRNTLIAIAKSLEYNRKIRDEKNAALQSSDNRTQNTINAIRIFDLRQSENGLRFILKKNRDIMERMFGTSDPKEVAQCQMVEE